MVSYSAQISIYVSTSALQQCNIVNLSAVCCVELQYKITNIFCVAVKYEWSFRVNLSIRNTTASVLQWVAVQCSNFRPRLLHCNKVNLRCSLLHWVAEDNQYCNLTALQWSMNGALGWKRLAKCYWSQEGQWLGFVFSHAPDQCLGYEIKGSTLGWQCMKVYEWHPRVGQS